MFNPWLSMIELHHTNKSSSRWGPLCYKGRAKPHIDSMVIFPPKKHRICQVNERKLSYLCLTVYWWAIIHSYVYYIKLVVSTPLKNISQLGWWQSPNINGKLKFRGCKPQTIYIYRYIHSVLSHHYPFLIHIYIYNIHTCSNLFRRPSRLAFKTGRNSNWIQFGRVVSVENWVTIIDLNDI